MMKRATVLSLLALPLVAATAHADEVAPTTTQQAGTVVVVTPAAPVVVSTAPAQAQAPAPAPAIEAPGAAENPPAPELAPPAPQNEPWSNVSHINGTLVKVGERNDYLIKYKPSNISVNPFGPFFGYYDGAFAHGITQNLAISGSIAGYYKSDSSSSHTMFQVTASLPIYFRRTFSGPFIEPGLIYRSSSYNDSYACSGCTDSGMSKSWFGPELLFGWHWTFDSGLNVSWAFGLAKHVTDTNSDPNAYSNSDEPDVNGYFRVGYNF